MNCFDDGRDWTTRRLGSVNTLVGGDRLSVMWDPKSGGPIVRIEGDIDVEECDDVDLDDDGYCRDYQALVLSLRPEQAEELAGWLTEAATASKAFFAERPPDPAPDAHGSQPGEGEGMVSDG